MKLRNKYKSLLRPFLIQLICEHCGIRKVSNKGYFSRDELLKIYAYLTAKKEKDNNENSQ